MGLDKVFTQSMVREIGRNYGKAISNSLLGDKHSTPIRVVKLGSGSAPRNYKHKLEKICKTWLVKGPTATFNTAQNIYYSFFDLVEEAKKDKDVNLWETYQLMDAFVLAHKELIKVCGALEDLGRQDLSDKADELDDRMFHFIIELNEGFVLPERPTGWFKKKKKERWDFAKETKDQLQKWADAYNAAN